MKAPHLAVDGLCPRFDKKKIKKMLIEICAVLDMHPISKPYVVYGADYNPGVSGFIFIEFSNIAIHTFERGDETSINVDCFSCKDFERKKVTQYLKKQGVHAISARRIWRDIKVL